MEAHTGSVIMKYNQLLKNFMLIMAIMLVGNLALAQQSQTTTLPPALRAAIQSGNDRVISQAIETLSGGNDQTKAQLVLLAISYIDGLGGTATQQQATAVGTVANWFTSSLVTNRPDLAQQIQARVASSRNTYLITAFAAGTSNTQQPGSTTRRVVVPPRPTTPDTPEVPVVPEPNPDQSGSPT